MSNKFKRNSIIEACSKQIEAIPFVTTDSVEIHMADVGLQQSHAAPTAHLVLGQ